MAKQDVAMVHPWLRQELYDLFDAAREEAGRRSGRVALPFGVEANRAPIEAVGRYAQAQGIVAQRHTADRLFPA